MTVLSIFLLGIGLSVGLYFIPHYGIIFLICGILLSIIIIAIISYITNGRRQVVKALFYLDLAKEKGNKMVRIKKEK
jgi:hypothetical protein